MEPARARPEAEPSPEEFLQLEPESDLRPLRRSSVGLYVLISLLGMAAVGIGAYAWQLSHETEKLKGDVARLEQVREETQQQLTLLLEKSGQEEKRASETSSERDQLREALAAASAKLTELQDASAADGQRLAEFRDLRAKFQRMIDSGALDITIRRGRMIVEMPAAVLFDSGSAELSKDGEETMVRVAKILRGVPRHRFLVGGHTDNVPVAKEYKSNWELSAARALQVTDTLIAHGVPPKRLVLAGYSEYDPVASNSSEAGRQKNRRIEIILEPYVDDKLVEGLLAAKADAAPAAKGETKSDAKVASARNSSKRTGPAKKAAKK
ncbi:MAG TPA: OmpA family protein [Polyangiaceae bacterium]|nr:OmpA family protein [Polyangiaceae bacterium]